MAYMYIIVNCIMKKDNKKSDEDVVFESSENEGIEESFEKKVKKLSDELKKCQMEKQEYLNGWQRAKADFINAQKDFEKQQTEIGKYVISGMLHEILPVVDSFEMAMKGEGWGSVDENWRKGVEYIHQQFVSILSNNGLTEIEALGKLFDTSHHSSVESVIVKDKNKDGMVIEVLQKGYAIDGKTIRPAKVKVGKYEK